MCCTTTLHWESFDTLIAFMWFLLCVYAHKFYETTINCNTFVTMHSLVWFFPCVCYKMSFKIIIMWKSLVILAIYTHKQAFKIGGSSTSTYIMYCTEHSRSTLHSILQVSFTEWELKLTLTPKFWKGDHPYNVAKG